MYNDFVAWGHSKYSSSFKPSGVIGGRREARIPLTPPSQDVPPQKVDGIEPKRSVPYMVIKATANDRHNDLALFYDEFRRSQSNCIR
ncbi:hypothetical protein TNCV_1622511 [Trichonephila clavipes]|nr:hypothetical protein TNCV_1622511 [Trichonephila clavipes]